MKIGKAISFNPSEKLKKGEIAKKIVMDKLVPHQKKVSGFEISPYNGGAKFRNGDTLLAKITPSLENGKTAQVDVLEEDEVGYGSTEFIVLRENLHSANDFIFYLAKSPTFRKKAISCMEGTSGRKRVNDKALQLQVLPIPDIQTQKRIAAGLSALDEKSEFNQRINAELEAMAKTIYEYWFVQFDFPDENGKPYKSSGGRMVWNEQLKRDIPAGWEVKPLGEVLETHLGGTPSTKAPEYWDNGSVVWLNSRDLTNIPIIESSSFVTQKGVDNSAATVLPKGSVVISLVRYIRPSILGIEACASQSVVGLCETEHLKKSFIYPFLVHEVPRFMALRTGAQQPHINKGVVDDTLLYVPPESVLSDYYKLVTPIYEKIVKLAFQSQTLAELRDWLLPMLMNGQVKVG